MLALQYENKIENIDLSRLNRTKFYEPFRFQSAAENKIFGLGFIQN